jgi:gamma-glutamylcyclotransferase (GGCT)/AIG2-like uncharacterized protein YtfP
VRTSAQTTRILKARKSVEEARTIVAIFERSNPISEPWLKGSAPRVEAEVLRNNQQYHRLLDDLEHRAVSRRFEVEKLGLPNTGMYK